MPTQPIVRLGHPALRTPLEAVDGERLSDPEIRRALDDLVATLREAGSDGLAAPQLGLELQIFAYEVAEGDGRVAGAIPLRVVINPMITPHGHEQVADWEGCLSIPELRGLVPRHGEVRVRGLDPDGNRLDYVAEGLEARIVQHEYDHLNGVVFLDRMRDLRSLAYEAEWRRYLRDAGEEPEPTALG